MTSVFLLVGSLFFFYFVRMKTVFVFLVLVLFATFFQHGVFVVNEGSQVVITQFGKIIGNPYKEAGLYFKIPFLWKANYFDKRIYTDSEMSIPAVTKDHYFISTDLVVNWQVVDPDLFFVRISNENDDIRILLRNIVSGSVREAISNYNLVDAVRSEDIKQDIGIINKEQLMTMENNDLGLLDKITFGRTKINKEIYNSIVPYAKEFGIVIVNVLIVDIKYNKAVEEYVFQKMVLKQLKKAAKIRASGINVEQQIQGMIAKKYQEIIAPAKKEALIIRGQADARATKIYADAYKKDPEFYNFWRTIVAYKDSIPVMSRGLILSTDVDFLNLIKQKKSAEFSPPLKHDAFINSSSPFHNLIGDHDES